MSICIASAFLPLFFLSLLHLGFFPSSLSLPLLSTQTSTSHVHILFKRMSGLLLWLLNWHYCIYLYLYFFVPLPDILLTLPLPNPLSWKRYQLFVLSIYPPVYPFFPTFIPLLFLSCIPISLSLSFPPPCLPALTFTFSLKRYPLSSPGRLEWLCIIEAPRQGDGRTLT